MAVKSGSDAIVAHRVKPRMTVEQYREKLGLKRLTVFGEEVPDPTPIAPPVNLVRAPSIFEQVREAARKVLDERAAAEEFDTEEEDNNFNIPEDQDPVSRREFTEMEEEFLNKVATEHNNKLAQAKEAAKAARERSEPPLEDRSQGAAKPPREALDGDPEAAKGDKK